MEEEFKDKEYKAEKKFNLKHYNLIFHYNHYKEKWSCFHRDEYREYFNGAINKIGLGNSPEEAYINYTKYECKLGK